MVKYVVKRIVYLIFVFFILSILLFILYQSIPGDPVKMMLDSRKAGTDPKTYQMMYEAMQKQLGLNRPLWIQYLSWMNRLLHGDYGYSSVYRMEVAKVVALPLKNTICLNFIAFLCVFSIAIPVGILSAVKEHSSFDYVLQIGTVTLYSLPTFIVALLIIYIFGVKLSWFPISGMQTPGLMGSRRVLMLDRLYHMAMPLLVMIVSSVGGIIRYIRSAMIEVLHMDYIKTARAKGVNQRTLLYSHALRNAMIPVVTIVTSWFVAIFGGSVVVESIFGFNGIGKVLYDALRQQDYAVVLAMQMFYVVISLIGNLIMDLGYCLVDPRIKYSS